MNEEPLGGRDLFFIVSKDTDTYHFIHDRFDAADKEADFDKTIEKVKGADN
jgi:hypothetical protein